MPMLSNDKNAMDFVLNLGYVSECGRYFEFQLPINDNSD